MPSTTIDTVGNWINGRTATSDSPDATNVYRPATGEVTKRVPAGSRTDAEAAVAAAHRAFESWSATPPHIRARVMFAFRDRLLADIDDLAAIICDEHGKVLDDARGELQRGIEVVEFACGIPDLMKGEFTENVGTNVDGMSMRKPLGVVVGVVPFNFPAMVPMWMFPIALVCGNTFVLKPSEKVPTLALKMASMLADSGLPDGVFNVVQGGQTVVNALITDPRVEAVSFVGSTPIAEHIYRTATESGKRVQALGGAKNHLVVMPDADIDSAVNALMGSAFGSAGERCMAISVVVPIGDEVAQAVRDRLVERIAALRVGAGTEPDVEMGPLITREHRDRVISYLSAGVEDGAELVVDGRDRCDGPGFFLGASLFDHVTPEMRIYREEIFGPVLAMVRAESFEEALELVNDHEFGNGTALFTADGGTARTFISRVRAGMVGINVPIPVPMAFHSFGGWKRSLFGDHHIHGREGVRFYTRYKTATIRWPQGRSSAAEFVMPTAK
ncbi:MULTISPECIES: CoA-acylating methylmalonate-semialdehyde dehydrogenase [Gordonia]|uniref:methylmalonate-semialdehyde dehydrogenase (CoA acylating) n=2 Tax=Gordonia TaxID=2053 RepID=L7LMP9_9ACTN|nr:MULTISPECIES: CoA-acylating methylmalonate-semialdehyde dehydrogenase [Gordonia]AUH67488.1 methylmalonate-semialdehyde dehydrogenase (CoA acylating) [Gordonia sp. YC-JH1]GAC61382.1 methylmalonate-semialdehyde dehydrogenase [Gordonia sihwensis NBRC 108236]